MGIGGIGFSVQHYFREAVKRKYSGDDAEQWEGKELKENKGTFVENPAERNIEKQVLGLSQPEDIAHIIMFLLSDASRMITGRYLYADGGLINQ